MGLWRWCGAWGRPAGGSPLRVQVGNQPRSSDCGRGWLRRRWKASRVERDADGLDAAAHDQIRVCRQSRRDLQRTPIAPFVASTAVTSDHRELEGRPVDTLRVRRGSCLVWRPAARNPWPVSTDRKPLDPAPRHPHPTMALAGAANWCRHSRASYRRAGARREWRYPCAGGRPACECRLHAGGTTPWLPRLRPDVLARPAAAGCKPDAGFSDLLT